MANLLIKHLASGGVITNYHCVSRCGHCLYNCGTHRSRAYLDGSMAVTIFQRIAALGCCSVHIGGGEPLLNPRQLKAVLAAAGDAGVAIDYVETNSAWFVDSKQAEDLLSALRSAGVSTLLVSISPFHNAHIPLVRIKGVIDACRRSDMQVFPWVNAFLRDLSRLDERRTHSMEEFKAVFGEGYLKRIPERYWIHLGGRALDTFRSVYPLHPIEHILDNCPLSCFRALSDTSHFHIDLYGNYIPGLCAGLAIAMEDLGKALPEGKYPLLDRLTAVGIRGLFDFAVQTYGFTPAPSGYLNHCDLCTDIRRFLVQNENLSFPELGPMGFYKELLLGT
jgi:hypothetical protein